MILFTEIIINEIEMQVMNVQGKQKRKEVMLVVKKIIASFLLAMWVFIGFVAEAAAPPPAKLVQTEEQVTAAFKKTIAQEMEKAKESYKGIFIITHGRETPYEWCRRTQELETAYKVTVQKATGNGPAYVAVVEFQKKNLYYGGKTQAEMWANTKPNDTLLDSYVLTYVQQDGKWIVATAKRKLWSSGDRWFDASYTSVYTAAKYDM